MLKTPPRLAGLGIALTMCALGAGGALTQMAEAPTPEIIEFEQEIPGMADHPTTRTEAPVALSPVVDPSAWNC